MLLKHLATSLRPANNSEATGAELLTSAVAQVLTVLTAILYPDNAGAATACAAATAEYDNRVSGEMGVGWGRFYKSDFVTTGTRPLKTTEQFYRGFNGDAVLAAAW
jgi:hypothetical protein